MRTVYLGLGTNLDDRNKWLDRGLRMLEEALVEHRAVESMTLSPRYETEAWGMAPGTPCVFEHGCGVRNGHAFA